MAFGRSKLLVCVDAKDVDIGLDPVGDASGSSGKMMKTHITAGPKNPIARFGEKLFHVHSRGSTWLAEIRSVSSFTCQCVTSQGMSLELLVGIPELCVRYVACWSTGLNLPAYSWCCRAFLCLRSRNQRYHATTSF